MDLVNVGCIMGRGICKIPKTRKRILILSNWKMVSMVGNQCKEAGTRQTCLEPSDPGPC